MEAGRESIDQAGIPEPCPEDRERAGVYSTLGVLLADVPGPETLAWVADAAGGMPQEDPGAEGAEGAVGRAWRELARAAGEADPEAVDEEYHDLFIGLGRGELVPFASWYRSGLLLDKPLVLLRRDLEAMGIERQPGTTQPEDHAAALCEVMALLAGEGQPLDRQRDFFEEHLGPWLGRFFQDLQGADSAHFYRAVGRLGSAFIQVEQGYLRMPE